MIKTTLKNIIVRILEVEAKLVLKKYKPKIIAVTGSVGKTSVKDAVYVVFSTKFKTRKSDKSYNSELGVPLTILNRPSGWSSVTRWLENILDGLALIIFPHTYPTWLVLEVGADRPGDIKKLCQWLKPNIAIITRLPEVPAHIEFFPSKESLIAEKTVLAKSIQSEGTVILNYDDENVRALEKDLKSKVITYGFAQDSLVRGSDDHMTYTERGDQRVIEGMTFKLNYNNDIIPVWLKGALGRHHVYTVLAAIAAGVTEGINPVDMALALSDYKTPPGRMRVIEGIKASTIIDDTYNSSPAAVEAGLDSLAEIEAPRKIAVLGDMLELGEHTIDAHKAVGKYVADKVSFLYVVGLRAKFIAEGAIEAGLSADKIFFFADAVSAGKDLQNLINKGDVIYVKGSQMMRLEKTVEEIMLHPDQKTELLCRQDNDWKER